ncbi:MAG TPA: YbhB/YbcL family Raf kinase inhibitor-like protein [Bacteroidales bacterium]|jgi:Raf kinase inhibitor-like YbhB/YbcL family protein|nr:YbhB/YbcL family Raf kinase inhibitor-like protein [Bacteroidales bacterium]HHW60074.1 YbhB/YbcL family Raf kinase inhibitor-like protein [Bacteroidales bacterium]
MKNAISISLIIFCIIFSSNQCKNKSLMSKEIIVKSKSFIDGGMIPSKYTCDGANVSPQISWENIPEGTKSLALICDDPDAPMGTFVHWVLYDIPPMIKELPENILPEKILPSGAKHGVNDFRKYGYGGPCPPSGTHRYYFKLYALDTMLNLEPGKKKAELLKEIEGHIIAQGQIMGKYSRN